MYFCLLYQNSDAHRCVDLCLGLQSVPLISMAVFMPITCGFYCCNSVVQLEIRDGRTSCNSFIVQDCFSYPGHFVFPFEVDNCPFKVCNELCWNFYGNCVESVVFGKMAIFTILILINF